MGDPDTNPTKQPRGVFPVSRSKGVSETTPVNPEDILDRLETLEIYEWDRAGNESNINYLGPSAEDFFDLFELGEDVERITVGDVDGVALTAIKELSARLDEQNALIDRHEARLERQQKIITDQRDDIETLREHLESIQTTVVQLRRHIDDRE
jgi:chromosome segregation ATPase